MRDTDIGRRNVFVEEEKARERDAKRVMKIYYKRMREKKDDVRIRNERERERECVCVYVCASDGEKETEMKYESTTETER